MSEENIRPKSQSEILRHKITVLERLLQEAGIREKNLETSHAAQGEALRRTADLSATVAEALGMKQAAEEENTRLRADLLQVKQNYDQLAEEATASADKVTQLETVIASGRTENEQLRERLTSKEESLAQALRWKAELVDDHTQLGKRHIALLQDKQSWTANLDAAQLQARVAEQKAVALEEQLQGQIVRNSTLAEEVNHLHDLLLVKSNELAETRRQLHEEREAHDPIVCGAVEGDEYCQLKRMAKKDPEGAAALLHQLAPFPESLPPGPSSFPLFEGPAPFPPTSADRASARADAAEAEPLAQERRSLPSWGLQEIADELAYERGSSSCGGLSAEEIAKRWAALAPLPSVGEAFGRLKSFHECFPSIREFRASAAEPVRITVDREGAEAMKRGIEKTADTIVSSMMKPTPAQREMVLREIRESLKRYPDAPMDLGIKEEIERLRLEAILQSLSAQPLPNEGKRGGKSANPPPAWRNWTSWLRRHLRFSLLAPKSPPISLKEPLEEMTLAKLQKQAGDWLTYNFGDEEGEGWINQFFCMVEEIGELAHASLKQRQGIRGTKEELEEKVKDAAADVIIATAGFCFRRGIDLQTAVEMAWAEVRVRDWTKERQKNGKG